MESTGMKAVGGVMAASGALVLLSGALHPRPEGATVTEAAIGMVGTEGWVVAHLPQALGMVLLLVAALLLRRIDGITAAVRTAATVTAAGAAVAVVESVPHMLAGTEAAALAAGGSTPLYDTHMWLQVVATPLTGFGVAALSWVASRDGVLGPRPLAILGVVGGVGFGLAGPAVAFTESMLLARLFMLTAAMALWLLVAGAVTVRAAGRRVPGRPVAGVP